MARKTGPLTDCQKVVLQTYADGDFSHIETMEEFLEAYADGQMDGLIHFMIIELDPGESCENWDMAMERLRDAKKEIGEVLVAVQNADPGNAMPF